MPPMPAPLSGGVFHKLSVGEFTALLASVTLQRTIDAVHLHHTWRPRHRDYRGHETIVSMWRFHTRDQGWSDIAQHLTIAPDGDLWTGRHWDRPPASASGHNGSSLSGPFMIEMIGDFDAGQDPFAGAQRDAALGVLAALLDKFQLPASAIRFHNSMSTKTCPGTSIDRVALLAAVDAARASGSRAMSEAPRPSPFEEKDEAIWHARAFLRSAGDGTRGLAASPTTEDAIAELPEADRRDSSRAVVNALEAAAASGRGVDITLTPEIKEALRPFVVNLTRGKFSSSGEFTTDKSDVDRMFDEHLPRALTAAGADPLRIVVYAHGGLVGELDGLGVALKHIDWWRRNGVYPIYFTWESDFLGALLNIIRSAIGGQRDLGTGRDGFDILDAQIEAAARKAKASSIWADMKHTAELASAPDGGAKFVAGRLADFVNAHAGKVEVHVIGHSAGSNFHSHFVPSVLDAGLTSIKTMQFLAPAITVDGFFARLSPRLGSVGPITIYTMKDPLEQADDCKGVYHKSLLYLVSRALEEKRDMDLLGLEISIRNDLRLKRMFGLDGAPSVRGHEIVWSQTVGDRRASSESISHGGFDDDPSTMNSALRRVLGLSGAQDLVSDFVAPTRSVDAATWSQGLPVAAATPALPGTIAGSTQAVPQLPAPVIAGGGGRRRALCVGINTYRQKPLSGCVADAQRWAETLSMLNFEVLPLLVNEQATRDRILRELGDLIARSRPGDIVAFQFAGHGTTLPDVNGDEADGDSPGFDEALCPYDFTEGRFVIDDDLAEVFGAAPDGVLITSFIDCCHSGTISRLGVGPGGAVAIEDPTLRSRFIEVDQQTVAAHVAFRAYQPGGRAVQSRGSAQRDVLFSACRSTEVAWESQGQGDFTRHATAALRAGVQNLTNGSLLSRINTAFGASPRQHPELHPADALARALFAGVNGSGAPSAATPGASPLTFPDVRKGDVAGLLRAIAEFVG